MTQRNLAKSKSMSKLGIVEWFRPGEQDRVSKVIEKLESVDIRYLRTGFSWADWHRQEGKEWYQWLFPELAKHFEILPCFTYTPPSLGIEPKTSSPPKRPKDYADFLDEIISRFGKYFEWLELWNEPNNISDWDWRMDPDWKIFCDMIGKAAFWAQKRNKKTLLGGMSPTDTNWLNLMCCRNVINHIDAVGIHGFPGTWDFDWKGWADHTQKVKVVLDKNLLDPEIWITEAGFSTWNHDEFQQLIEFANALNAPVKRCYWYSAQDLNLDTAHQDGFHKDERHYHFGLFRSDETDKLTFRILKQNGLAGLENISKYNGQISPALKRSKPKKFTLITGGAGFIGTNIADQLLSTGENVIIYDNLSRLGVEKNIRWIKQRHGDKVIFRIADTRNRYALKSIIPYVDKIFHFAAQVAVTTSLEKPMHDFNVNLTGTMNLLEEIRRLQNRPALLFTSTNKVYGNLNGIPLRQKETRYEPVDEKTLTSGINEKRCLDFHSPYGCSKGAADQYVLDYCRMYEIPAVVFRMSCIYSRHQFGTEDQGWVAHFLIPALKNKTITLYGSGKQVRDILYIDDLVNAMNLAMKDITHLRGNAFNIGGGIKSTTSLCELLSLMEELIGIKVKTQTGLWRKGDQKYYVSDTGYFQQMTGWKPRTNIRQGVTRLYEWLLEENENLKNTKAREISYV